MFLALCFFCSFDGIPTYRNNTIKHAQPKVDNKAPLLDATALYKPGVLESRATKLSQIEEENFLLIQQINIIYRTHGKTDCSKPKSMDQRKTNFKFLVDRNKKIFKENIELLTNIINVRPRVDFEEIEKEYNKHLQVLLFMSKHPEYYKKKIDKDDPLAVGLTKDVQIQKSKCYMDVRDSTAGKSMGRLTIELYDGVVPETAGNFAALCGPRAEDRPSYAGTQFFRIVPGLFCLAGDVEYSIGIGGTSAVQDRRYFDDENYALSHNAPGTLSMYNFEKNKNASQFLITFKPLTTLDGRYVVFGRVVDGMNTLKLIEDLGLKSGKPKHNIVIKKCGTFEKQKKS